MTNTNTHFIEIRTLNKKDLRNLCIAKNWYTYGTTKEYESLLKKCDSENIQTNDIIDMASDIMQHSEKSDRSLENYCFEIANICTSFFKKE